MKPSIITCSCDPKFTPRASPRHLIDPPSPPTWRPLLLRLFTVASSRTVGGWVAQPESGTPCHTRWAVHDHSLPLFAATRRPRIGRLRPHQLHSGYRHELHVCDQSCSFETIHSSLKYQVDMERSDCKRCRPASSFLPPASVDDHCVIPNPDAENEWTQSE